MTFTKVRDDGCSIAGAATGTLKLSGNPDGSGFRAEVNHPSIGLVRGYMGTIRVDGSFNGTGAGITPGAIGRTLDVQPAHEYEGTIVGQVIGNNVTATETLTITVGCAGRPIVVYNIAGSK